ncbi:MAG: hypothetical protein H7Y43_05995 [Akkermansiaceae bacterium]|nr:hypothetical protein [Verrucomicrobiales bacterium]
MTSFCQEVDLDHAPKILGANSCSSSGCHGGGGAKQNEFQVWALRDFHNQRPFATLTTARSKQIGEALGIKNPAEDLQCTICHAPLHSVAAGHRPGVKISEGVSCESCHGPAETWLRGHTRSDWSPADRTAAGMRNLKNLYERANTCVACHQTVELPLLKAGHPELLFELDGQMVSQPRHWRETTNFSGGQAWLVGQAVALRELSGQLAQAGFADPKLNARWQAALWLMQKVAPTVSSVSLPPAGEPAPEKVANTLKASDQLARAAAQLNWTSDFSAQLLRALAGSSSDFRRRELSNELQARRAERLVLALDRLTNDARGNKPSREGEAELNELFKLAQSIPDFDREAFAGALQKFAAAIERR